MTSAGPARGAGDAGFALAAVVLLLIALMGLAHAALVTAQREAETSVLEASLVARRIAARAAADALGWRDSLPAAAAGPTVVRSGSEGLLRWSAEVVLLDREIGLWSGIASVSGVARADRVGVLVWSLEPTARVADARGVIEIGGDAVVRAGGISVSGWMEAPTDAVVGSCFAELRALDSLRARRPETVSRREPKPGIDPFGSAPPGLGLLQGDSVLARAEDRMAGSVSAIGSAPTLVGADGDLTITGGHGAGVIVTRGSLRLTDDARFDGVVLVGSDLTIDDRARLRGWALVGRNLRVEERGEVEGSACTAARALRALPVLRAPLRLPGPRIHPM